MKKLIFSLLFVISSLWLTAAAVSFESAKKVAINFYHHNAGDKASILVSDVVTYQKENITTFYIFVFEAGGFVMVSADDAVIPVLGYSINEPFDKNNISPNAQSWFNDYNKQIKFIVDNGIDNSQTLLQWNKIMTINLILQN